MHHAALDDANLPCQHAGVRADRRREVAAIVMAFVAHVLFLTLAPRTPTKIEPPARTFGASPQTPPPIVDVAADATIDIDSTVIPKSSTPAMPAARAPAQTAPARTPSAQTGVRTPSTNPAPELPADPNPDEPSETDSQPVKPSPAPDRTDEYGSPPPPDAVAGIPGLSGPLWSVPGAMPSTGPPKPAPTTIAAAPATPDDVGSRVLSGTLHSRDKAAGIDVPAAGVVATSIADALRASALTDAKGTFEVKLGAGGNVESIRFVGSTDGDASQWAAVAEAARRSLASRTLQMGADKQGVTVVVKVESKIQYPAGTKERIEVKPVCANEVVEQLAAAIEGAMQPGRGVRGIRDDQGHFIPYSELDDERRTRFCIPIGIQGRGDVSNIGAHMTNVVSSSFQVKRSGEQALPAETPKPIDRAAPWLPVTEGKTRPPPPPPKKKTKKKKPRRGSIVPVQLN